MAKVTWHGDGETPSIEWNGITFPAGTAVEVSDANMIRKATGKPSFTVEDSHEQEKEVKGEEAKEYNWREAQRTGYTPVKKKVRKKKPPDAAGA